MSMLLERMKKFLLFFILSWTSLFEWGCQGRLVLSKLLYIFYLTFVCVMLLYDIIYCCLCTVCNLNGRRGWFNWKIKCNLRITRPYFLCLHVLLSLLLSVVTWHGRFKGRPTVPHGLSWRMHYLYSTSRCSLLLLFPCNRRSCIKVVAPLVALVDAIQLSTVMTASIGKR